MDKAALWGLRKIYRPGYKYHGAGVMLSELVSGDHRQDDLFSTISTGIKPGKLMEVIDYINDWMGAGTIHLAS